MAEVLIVVDMQNDFIDGALGSAEAVAIVPKVVDKVRNFEGRVIFTRDTHFENYLDTQEGKNLPVPHCIKDSEGWQICEALRPYCNELPINKPSFGSPSLAEQLKSMDAREHLTGVTLVGLCTDICVISNAMLIKAAIPEVPITVDASCCAGVSPASHKTALEAMKMCQIRVINE